MFTDSHRTKYKQEGVNLLNLNFNTGVQQSKMERKEKITEVSKGSTQ